MAKNNKLISLLVPAYNEDESLMFLYDAVKNVMDSTDYFWEMWLIDDGSRDNTLSVMKKLHEQDERVHYVALSRNFGKEKAMLAGFDSVQGDCCVILDADLQHPPHVIPEMIKKWECGIDDVYAQRITRGKESWLRRKISLLFYAIQKKLSDVEILPNVGDFRLLDRKCVDTLCQLRESERYTKGLYCWIGFKKDYIEFETQDRIAGTSSWNYRSLFKLAIEGLISFSVKPLRLSVWMGLVISMIAFVYAIWVVFKTLVYGDPVAGYPTIMVVMLLLGGLQLLSLGILGEYIGKIFIESKKRPIYVIREKA